MIMIMLSALSLVSCGSNDKKALKTYKTLADLEHARIGTATGSVQAIQAEDRFPDAEISYYDNVSDMISALRSGKIDAFVNSDAIIKYLMPDHPEMMELDEKIKDGMKVCAIFSKDDKGKALCDEYSEYIKQIKENGTYDKFYDKWFGGENNPKVEIDPEKLPSTKGDLHVAVDTTMTPFIFVKDGDIAGIDADIFINFCKDILRIIC